jgi:RNA polymerase sigma-70 factor (ECF subfamily)
MVFGVCRRVVGNHHDAEDAFQATFLVLARKASSVRPRERLANWLHGVALRTALKAKAATVKRRGREKQVTELPEPEAAEQDRLRDWQPLLDQELNGLPEHYRLPILLCDLEGKAIKEAAGQLGWPQGTLAGRLARGRKLLAKRLANRGVVLSAGSLAAVVSPNGASAGMPTSLMSSTVKAATIIAAGQAVVAGVVPAKVAVLMEGAMKSMMLTKLSKAVAGLVVLGVVAFGGGAFTYGTAAGQQTKGEQEGDKPASGPSTPLKRDAGSVAKHDTARTDLDRLQGVWSVVSIEQGGKPAKLEKAVFMVDGKRACWQTSESEMQGGLYLETSSKPRTYDFVMSTRTIEGIYSLDGDTLRLCQDVGPEAKRPVGFATKKGSHQILFVLKRTHGPEVFPFRLADGSRAFPTLIEKVEKAMPPPQVAPTPKDSVLRAGEGKQITVEFEKQKTLQGSWTPVSVEVMGKQYPKENLDILTITFKGDRLVFNHKDNPTETFTYKIDAEKNPHRLNLTWSDGPLKGKTTTMTYQIKDDMLRLSNVEAKQVAGTLTFKRTEDGKAKQSQ